jgi:hypothetical protein
MYRFDDAMRGWGYEPLYEPKANQLWREAQAKNDTSYRGVAVRDEECVYRRLVGAAVHELIHLFNGDPEKANYGVPFGLPYGVPLDVPAEPRAERAYLDPFNRAEARAWVGIADVAEALFGIDWTLRTARDVGTYGFVPGNARVDVPPGFRRIAHVDRTIQPERYYDLARRIEEEERAWFSDARLAQLSARFADAEARGRAQRSEPYPAPERIAALGPKEPGRNEMCGCGSGKKYKKCCGA